MRRDLLPDASSASRTQVCRKYGHCLVLISSCIGSVLSLRVTPLKNPLVFLFLTDFAVA